MRSLVDLAVNAVAGIAVCIVVSSVLGLGLPIIAHAAPAGAADPADAVDDALDALPLAVHGPRISAVLAAAFTAAGLDRDPQTGWIRRARLSGLVPWLTVRTARDTSWQDDSADVGHSTSLELRATWRLDRLLFDGRELQVATIEAARRRERRRLATRVIREYFTWRRAASAAHNDERTITRAAESAAELDALTDGWFTEQLVRSGRIPNVPRAVP